MTSWAPVLIWLGVIAFLTLTPQPFGVALETVSEIATLAGHFGLFGILTWLSLRAQTKGSRPGGLPAVTVLAAVLVLASVDEWIQASVPGRTSSALDLAADAAGIVIFAAAWRLWSALSARKRNGGHGERAGEGGAQPKGAWAGR